jgi:exoribonuclease II
VEKEAKKIWDTFYLFFIVFPKTVQRTPDGPRFAQYVHTDLEKNLADVARVLHAVVELVQLQERQVRLQVVADFPGLPVNVPARWAART